MITETCCLSLRLELSNIDELGGTLIYSNRNRHAIPPTTPPEKSNRFATLVVATATEGPLQRLLALPPVRIMETYLFDDARDVDEAATFVPGLALVTTEMSAALSEGPDGLTEDWTASPEGPEGLAGVGGAGAGVFEEDWSASPEGADGLAVVEGEAEPEAEPSVVPPAMVAILV